MWHAKGNGKGLVNLDESFINKEGFFKTQAAVLNLLLQKDETEERLYPPNKHIIWLNNLFISIKLLTKL